MRKVLFHFILLFVSINLNAQTTTNLERFYGLIDKSAESIIERLQTGSEFRVNFEAPDEFIILKNRVLKAFKEKSPAGEVGSYLLNYNIVSASVEYPEIFRNGFLGSFMVSRKINFNVDYTLEENGRIIDSGSFVESAVDTVEYEKVKRLENFSLPFTQGELPPEPVFSGLLEPVVAIGTAAVAVYLLFTVRSK